MQLGNSCAYSKGQLGSRAQFGREGLALKGVGVVRIRVVTNTHRTGPLGFRGKAWRLIRMGLGV